MKAVRCALIWVLYGSAITTLVTSLTAATIAALLPIPHQIHTDASRLSSAFDGLIFGAFASIVLQTPGSAVCMAFVAAVCSMRIQTGVRKGLLVAAVACAFAVGLFLVGARSEVEAVLGHFYLAGWGGFIFGGGFLASLLSPLAVPNRRALARAWLLG